MIATTVLASFLTLFTPSRRLVVNVTVADEDGRPIPDAEVIVRTRQHVDLWTNGPAKKPIEETSKTDKKGCASISLSCYSGRFGVVVVADGYYSGGCSEVRVKSEANPDDVFSVKLLEHEKNVAIKMFRKINPIPMFSYRRGYYRKEIRSGDERAYDLECGDWLPPFGKGRTADFRMRYHKVETNGVVNVWGEIEFDDGGGFYSDKMKQHAPVRSDYTAKTNALFVAKQGFRCQFDAKQGKVLFSEGLIKEDEYVVLRTRAKFDEDNNLVEAHYSKIYGPMEVVYGFGYLQSCFNPTANDTNLEFNPRKNLAMRQAGKFVP